MRGGVEKSTREGRAVSAILGWGLSTRKFGHMNTTRLLKSTSGLLLRTTVYYVAWGLLNQIDKAEPQPQGPSIVTIKLRTQCVPKSDCCPFLSLPSHLPPILPICFLSGFLPHFFFNFKKQNKKNKRGSIIEVLSVYGMYCLEGWNDTYWNNKELLAL